MDLAANEKSVHTDFFNREYFDPLTVTVDAALGYMNEKCFLSGIESETSWFPFPIFQS